MNELALFAGAGGGILGGHLLGWRTVCAVEWEAYPASVLCARQNDGLLPPFPIWDDVQTFDGKPWREIVDVVSGGFPCQDISSAGKGAGIDGERSGMWREMARIIHEVRPKFVFVENSPMLTSRGLGRVLGDLASMGFDARWGVLGAADVGANHKRDRIWIVAKWRGQLPHAQHNRIRWWEQQQTSIKKSSRELAYTTQLFSDGGNNNTRISMERETQSKFGNNCGESNISNSISIGLQKSTNKQQLESKGSNQLQIEQPGDTSQMDDTNTNSQRWEWSTGESGTGTQGQSNRHSSNLCTEISNSSIQRCEERSSSSQNEKSASYVRWHDSHRQSRVDWWATEPNVGRVANGVAARVDRLKAIGNGQVPLCAATAWRILSESL